MIERPHNSDSAHEQGSGFARGAAGSLLAKPSGRAVKSIAQYERELDPLPDYAADPGLWRTRMEHYAHAYLLNKRGIKNQMDRNHLVNAALNAAAMVKPGDERAAWRCVVRERQALVRRQKAYEAHRKLVADVRRWLVTDCALNTDIVKTIVNQSDIENRDRPLLDRLIDVTIMSINYQFNARRQYAAHWAANALDERVVWLWHDVHVVGEEKGWALQERVQKLNIALGGVAHIYMYPRSPEQAIAAFKEFSGEKPIEPPEVKAMAGNKFATFMGSFSNLCEFHKVPVDDTIRDAIRHEISKKLYGVESFKDLPDSADTILMTKELKAYLDTHYPIGKAAVGIGDAGAEPPEPEEKVEDFFDRKKITDQKPASEAKQDAPAIPIATPIPTRELVPQTAPALGIVNPMSEAAFVVLINLIAPWGAEMKFTIRAMTAEQLADQVDTLIKTFTARGYATVRAPMQSALPIPASNVTSFVQPAVAMLPMAVGQAAPVPAPTAAPSGAPDGKGRVPGQTGTDAITGVAKAIHKGKTIIELYAGGQYADHRLRLDTEHAMVTALGVDIDKMVIGTTYPAPWKADWRCTSKLNEKGNYYRDVTAIRLA